MSAFEEMQTWSDQRLIEKFEKNCLYDCHSFLAKFDRSWARKILIQRSQKALRQIIDHLRNAPPSNFCDLDNFWGYLLNHIEIEIDPDKSGPQKLNDTAGWIEWAEKFAT